MIFEHEIPEGSHLYFGESARIKRDIENRAAEMLEERGFVEMVTPLFSYHQHESFDDPKALIRLNDAQNHEVSLRADSTADVVRIATKRLGRVEGHSERWFYIQPVYRFPTVEQNQIGVEHIGGEFTDICNTGLDLLEEIEMEPLIQLANIAIPRLLSEKYGVELDRLKGMNIESLGSSSGWLERLVRINRVEDLTDLSPYPGDIAVELEAIAKASEKIECDRIVVSPLYYAKLRYYDSLIFRAFEGNSLYMMGGTYGIEENRAAGFALYTDACIVKKCKKGKNVS
jgi:histidyl-tRNA synthetase